MTPGFRLAIPLALLLGAAAPDQPSRLTGTIIASDVRRAVFASADGPRIVEPGETLDGWKIDAIEPGRVTAKWAQRTTRTPRRRRIGPTGADGDRLAQPVRPGPRLPRRWRTQPCPPHLPRRAPTGDPALIRPARSLPQQRHLGTYRYHQQH